MIKVIKKTDIQGIAFHDKKLYNICICQIIQHLHERKLLYA